MLPEKDTFADVVCVSVNGDLAMMFSHNQGDAGLLRSQCPLSLDSRHGAGPNFLQDFIGISHLSPQATGQFYRCMSHHLYLQMIRPLVRS